MSAKTKIIQRLIALNEMMLNRYEIRMEKSLYLASEYFIITCYLWFLAIHGL